MRRGIDGARRCADASGDAYWFGKLGYDVYL